MTRIEQENNNIEKFSNVLLQANLGNLTLLEFSEVRNVGIYKRYFFNLRCKCGNIVERCYYSLLSKGIHKHCGCMKSEVGKLNHKLIENKRTIQKYYHSWVKYKGLYGLSNNWQDYFQFEKDYILIMNSKQFSRQKLTVLNSNLPLGIDNYKIVDQKEKQNNRKDNRYFTINSETKTLAQWSETLGFDYQYVYGQMRKNSKTFKEIIELLNQKK